MTSPRMGRRHFFLLAFAALPGCIGIELTRPHWPWEKTAAQPPVAQVAAMWADGLVVQPDPAQAGREMPGFAAKLYLFNQGMSQTLHAEGTLLVSLYDNTQAGQQNPAPKETWEIDAENLAKLLTRDTLGCAYNLWLPWSTISPQVNMVTLSIEYRAADGRIIYGAPTTFPVKTGGGFKPQSTLQVNQQSKK